VTRAERRRLRRNRREMRRLTEHPAPAVRGPARRYLDFADEIEFDDPRPSLLLRLRLRLRGVDAG